MEFLEDALIAHKILSTGHYHRYVPESYESQSGRMVLDSQALQHLEIVESSTGEKEGSLLSFVNHCMTPFGKRELKRWLLAPLTEVRFINQRQDAVKDLIKFEQEMYQVRHRFKAIPDLEKLLARIY